MCMVCTFCGITWLNLNWPLGGRTRVIIHSMGVVRIFFKCDFISNAYRVFLLANSLLKVIFFFYESLH